MAAKAYQERLITLVRDTVSLLCKNGLEYNQEFAVEGLLGVTLDKNEVFLIPIKELVADKGVGTTDTTDDVQDVSQVDLDREMSPKRERKKKRRHAESTVTQEDTVPPEWSSEAQERLQEQDYAIPDEQTQTPSKRSRNMDRSIDHDLKNVKAEDIVVIKEEVDDDEIAEAFQDNSLDGTLNQTGNDPNVPYFQQGMSQGGMGFPMDQLPGSSGLSGAIGDMSGVEGDQSWLSQGSGGGLDASGQQGDWQGQKHQIEIQCAPIPKQKYRQYTSAQLEQAVKHVKEGNSIRKASKLTGVPTATISDSLLGKRKHKEHRLKTGPGTTLPEEDEDTLTELLVMLSAFGYLHTRLELRRIITDAAVYMQKREGNKIISDRCLGRFINSHQQLKMNECRTSILRRDAALKSQAVSCYFGQLEIILKGHGLMTKPGNIFHVEEVALTSSSGTGEVPEELGNDRANFAVLACCNASGQSIPPFLLLPNTDELDLSGVLPGSACHSTGGNRSINVILHKYVEKHLLKLAPESGSPLLLLYDGHLCHVSPRLIAWARERNVILFAVPAYMSKVIRGGDSCFSKLQSVFFAEFQAHIARSNSSSVSNQLMCQIACMVYANSFPADDVRASFQKMGVYPFKKELELVNIPTVTS